MCVKHIRISTSVRIILFHQLQHILDNLMRIRSFSKQLSARFSIGVTWLPDGLSVGKSICGHVCSTARHTKHHPRGRPCAWLSQHLWQHYLYTGDRAFLKTAYPALKGAADFFLDFLVEHPEYGWMVCAPSMSPEQGPPGTGTMITAGCTMDTQIVLDALTSVLSATQLLHPANSPWFQMPCSPAGCPPGCEEDISR